MSSGFLTAMSRDIRDDRQKIEKGWLFKELDFQEGKSTHGRHCKKNSSQQTGQP